MFCNILEFLTYIHEKHNTNIAVREFDKSGNPDEHSYNQLYFDVCNTAAALDALGLSGQHTVIMGENSYKWLVNFLSVIISGGIAVPFDKELPENDIRMQIEKSDVTAILCSNKSGKSVAGIDKEGRIKVFYFGESESNDKNLDLITEKIVAERGTDATAEMFSDRIKSDDQLAAIMFTSGTSGGHKAVQLTHKNITANIIGTDNVLFFARAKNSNFLSVLPMHHCYELFGYIMPCLYQGHTINISRGLRYFIQDIMLVKPYVVTVVPAFLEFLHKMKDKIKVNGQAFGNAKPIFMVGGAAPNKNILDDMNQMGLDIYLGYGMTEASPLIAVSGSKAITGDSAGEIMPYIDVTIDNPDTSGNGEILIKGPNVTPGYYKDDEANSESFSYDGWFKTGDIGHVRDDGRMVITGRKKNTIILDNGKNVQPEDIEKKADIMLPYADELIACEMDVDIAGTPKKVIGLVLYSEDENLEEKYGTQIDKDIAELNKELVSYSRVSCYVISTGPLPRSAVKIKRPETAEMANKMKKHFVQ